MGSTQTALWSNHTHQSYDWLRLRAVDNMDPSSKDIAMNFPKVGFKASSSWPTESILFELFSLSSRWWTLMPKISTSDPQTTVTVIAPHGGHLASQWGSKHERGF